MQLVDRDSRKPVDYKQTWAGGTLSAGERAGTVNGRSGGTIGESLGTIGKPFEDPTPKVIERRPQDVSKDGKPLKVWVQDDRRFHGQQRVDHAGFGNPAYVAAQRHWTSSGQTLRGEPLSPDDATIPDTLYHASPNVDAIMDSGTLRARGEGGLGGDSRDKIVSLTADRETAESIQDDMRLAIEMANADDVDAQDAIMLKYAAKNGTEADVAQRIRQAKHRAPEYYGSKMSRRDKLGEIFFAARRDAGGRHNPVFIGDDELGNFKGMSPAAVGIIEVPKDSLKTGAALTRLGDNDHLDEVRVYGDINIGGKFGGPGPVRRKADIDTPESLERVHEVFVKNGKELYLVGGAVRDTLTGKTPKDFDLATDATPDEVMEMLKAAGMTDLKETGKDFGVIRVFVIDAGTGGKEEYEIATFRRDLGKGRKNELDSAGVVPKTPKATGEPTFVDPEISHRIPAQNPLSDGSTGSVSLESELGSWQMGMVPHIRNSFDEGRSWIGKEIAENGELNTVPLYRGIWSERHQPMPEGGRHVLESWTTDRSVAEGFTGPQGAGPVFTAEPGTIRAINIGDIGMAGFADQNEFIGIEITPSREGGHVPGDMRPSQVTDFPKTPKGVKNPKVEFTTIDEDVRRRDLTINALFYDLSSREIVDYVGGIDDIENGVIRAVGDPSVRFDEDPLRVLRALRFSGRTGWPLDAATEVAIRNNQDLGGVSQERTREELLRGLDSALDRKEFIRMIDTIDQNGSLWGQLFPGLKVDAERVPNSKNNTVYLAALLSTNDPDAVAEALTNGKYDTVEKREIAMLHKLNGLSAEDAPALKTLVTKSKITPDDLRAYAKATGIPDDDIDAFISFMDAPQRVTSQSLMADGMAPSAEMGQAIRAAEIESYRAFMGKGPATYQGLHEAPGRGNGAPMHQLTDLYPDDVYGPDGARFYSHSGRETAVMDREVFAMFHEVRDKPDAEVTVFRAVPTDVDSIYTGDWVTPSRTYAESHGEGPMRGDYRIVAQRVRAGDLFTDANSPLEFGWDPDPERSAIPEAQPLPNIPSKLFVNGNQTHVPQTPDQIVEHFANEGIKTQQVMGGRSHIGLLDDFDGYNGMLFMIEPDPDGGSHISRISLVVRDELRKITHNPEFQEAVAARTSRWRKGIVERGTAWHAVRNHERLARYDDPNPPQPVAETIESIRNMGLMPGDITRVGNQNLGDAIFLSESQSEISHFASPHIDVDGKEQPTALLEIDLGKALSDGYLKDVDLTPEPDVIEVGLLKGLVDKLDGGRSHKDHIDEHFEMIGRTEATVVLQKPIPSRYISINGRSLKDVEMRDLKPDPDKPKKAPSGRKWKRPAETSGYWHSMSDPTSNSGYKAHVSSTSEAEVDEVLDRIYDTAVERGWGIKIGNQQFLDSSNDPENPNYAQRGKGVTVYLPKGETWQADVTELRRLMDGFDTSGPDDISDDIMIGNGVGLRYEFNRDPEGDIPFGDRRYFSLYRAAKAPQTTHSREKEDELRALASTLASQDNPSDEEVIARFVAERERDYLLELLGDQGTSVEVIPMRAYLEFGEFTPTPRSRDDIARGLGFENADALDAAATSDKILAKNARVLEELAAYGHDFEGGHRLSKTDTQARYDGQGTTTYWGFTEPVDDKKIKQWHDRELEWVEEQIKRFEKDGRQAGPPENLSKYQEYKEVLESTTPEEVKRVTIAHVREILDDPDTTMAVNSKHVRKIMSSGKYVNITDPTAGFGSGGGEKGGPRESAELALMGIHRSAPGHLRPSYGYLVTGRQRRAARRKSTESANAGGVYITRKGSIKPSLGITPEAEETIRGEIGPEVLNDLFPGVPKASDLPEADQIKFVKAVNQKVLEKYDNLSHIDKDSEDGARALKDIARLDLKEISEGVGYGGGVMLLDPKVLGRASLSSDDTINFATHTVPFNPNMTDQDILDLVFRSHNNPKTVGGRKSQPLVMTPVLGEDSSQRIDDVLSERRRGYTEAQVLGNFSTDELLTSTANYFDTDSATQIATIADLLPQGEVDVISAKRRADRSGSQNTEPSLTNLPESMEDLQDLEEVAFSADELATHYGLDNPGGIVTDHGEVVTFNPATGQYILMEDLGDGQTGISIHESFDDFAYQLDTAELEDELLADFRSEVTRMGPLLHGTSAESVAAIRTEGLAQTSETRGITNRGIGPAVFLTPNEGMARDSYGGPDGAVLEIDLPRAIADGVIDVENLDRESGMFRDDAMSAMASLFDDQDFYPEANFDGLDPETVVAMQHIPPEYISILDPETGDLEPLVGDATPSKTYPVIPFADRKPKKYLDMEERLAEATEEDSRMAHTPGRAQKALSGNSGARPGEYYQSEKAVQADIDWWLRWKGEETLTPEDQELFDTQMGLLEDKKASGGWAPITVSAGDIDGKLGEFLESDAVADHIVELMSTINPELRHSGVVFDTTLDIEAGRYDMETGTLSLHPATVSHLAPGDISLDDFMTPLNLGDDELGYAEKFRTLFNGKGHWRDKSQKDPQSTLEWLILHETMHKVHSDLDGDFNRPEFQEVMRNVQEAWQNSALFNKVYGEDINQINAPDNYMWYSMMWGAPGGTALDVYREEFLKDNGRELDDDLDSEAFMEMFAEGLSHAAQGHVFPGSDLMVDYLETRLKERGL